jgi:signal transduction histidine kinase
MTDDEQRAWGLFLDDLVHELRTPLTAVAGYTALLTEEGDALPPPLRDAARTVERQAERLGAQLALLLDIARLWSGRTRPAPRPLDAAVVARAVARRHGASVMAAGPCRLRAARADVVRALDILLDNARRHGAPPVSLTVAPADPDPRGGTAAGCTLTVADHGPGVPPEHVARIGRRPFQAPGRDAPPAGTGLSLVLAGAIAAAHGGALRYARESGVTRFTLTLAAPTGDDRGVHAHG